MNITRFAAAILALALAAPAAPAQDKAPHGLARLYQAAAERDAAALKQGRTGPSTDRTAAAPTPVQAVMRVERLPDGTLGVVCHTEPAPPGGPGPVLVHDHRRDRR